ncbi:MAG TPA: ABC transporter permease [Vicinamibacterales bacterium]|nr:ABC transporter permease [Vicinamibacterales bacterium]
MDALIQDIRYGIRQLFRQRGSSLVAVLTLALGIGVSSAIFSLIDATMLRPLPYPDPWQLVTLGPEEGRPDGRVSRPTPSMEDLRTWQAASDVFTAVAGSGSAFRGRIVEGPEPERIQVQHFTEDYLSMHGVAPLIGRDFVREDCDVGAPLVALLGYGYWQSHYGGRQDVIGESVRLDTEIATIVGVLPAWFNATTPLSIPLRIAPDEYSRRGTGRVSVYARLRPDVSIERARAQLSARMPSRPLPDGSVREVGVWVSSRLESSLSRYRTTVNVLAGAVGLILLIACVNVAGLLLARGAARQPELAVRASLGAGRGRLIRQLLTESVVLAVPGGALGVLLAWLSLDALVANIPLSLPSNSPVTLNLTVMAATAALLVPTSLLFGLAPAIRLSRIRIGQALARGGRQAGSSLPRRGSQLLIGAEVALAVVLVAGAGLMIRSFVRITAVDLGFRPDGLLTMEVLPLDRNPAAHKEYYSALLQQLRTIPGVSSAGLVDNFPLGGGTAYSSVSVAGTSTGTTVFEAMPGYFETIGATLRDGRLPTDADYASGFRGVVINDSAAREMFPDGPAVGRELTRAGRDPRTWTVLGVIADLRHGGPLDTRNEGQPQVYFPLEPTEFDLNQAMLVVVRPSGSVPGLGDRLRRVALSIGPRVLVERIRTGHDWFGDRVITPRRRTVLLGLLGGLGLTLALVGVFGMTAYAVTRRTTEIGVRMAFGARPGQVVRAIVRDSAVPIAAGTALGVGGALLATRVIESFLFETAPTDPVTLAAVALMLASAGCLAALVPALRAAKVDPVASLRAE